MKTKIILPHAGPLFSFTAIDGGLELLLAAGLPIVLTDYIEWKATRSGTASARVIRAWIDANAGAVSVIETERGQDRIAREKFGTTLTKQQLNIGEQTIS